MTREWEQTIMEARHPGTLGSWWRAAFGWFVVNSDPVEFEIRRAADCLPGQLFVPVPEQKTAKNRLHLDCRPPSGVLGRHDRQGQSWGAAKSGLRRRATHRGQRLAFPIGGEERMDKFGQESWLFKDHQMRGAWQDGELRVGQRIEH